MNESLCFYTDGMSSVYLGMINPIKLIEHT